VIEDDIMRVFVFGFQIPTNVQVSNKPLSMLRLNSLLNINNDVICLAYLFNFIKADNRT